MEVRALAVLISLGAAGTVGAAEGPRVFEVDAGRSRFALEVEPAGLAGRLGLLHGHVFVPEDVHGTIRFSPDTPEAAEAVVIADARTLVDEQDALSESDRRTVMRQVSQLLDVDEHPLLSLRVERFEVDEVSGSSWSGTLHGTLSLAGTPKSVAIPVDASLDGDTLTAQGTFPFRASRFGIEPDPRLLGAIDVKDEVTLRYEVTAHARDARR